MNARSLSPEPTHAHEAEHVENVLVDLDALIASRSILEHPFYQAWTRGELTSEQLRTYAGYYFPHVAAFPGYLETTLAGTTEALVRAELADNLREELAEPAPHGELWLDFAAGCGCDRTTVTSAPAQTGAAQIVATFDRLAATSTAAGLAALYAYESQQPEVAATKAHGLREHYGIDQDAALAYFTVHAEADLRHRAGERAALARCLEQGATRDDVLSAASRALDAYWKLLDGVCESTGIHC